MFKNIKYKYNNFYYHINIPYQVLRYVIANLVIDESYSGYTITSIKMKTRNSNVECEFSRSCREKLKKEIENFLELFDEVYKDVTGLRITQFGNKYISIDFDAGKSCWVTIETTDKKQFDDFKKNVIDVLNKKYDHYNRISGIIRKVINITPFVTLFCSIVLMIVLMATHSIGLFGFVSFLLFIFSHIFFFLLVDYHDIVFKFLGQNMMIVDEDITDKLVDKPSKEIIPYCEVKYDGNDKEVSLFSNTKRGGFGKHRNERNDILMLPKNSQNGDYYIDILKPFSYNKDR